MRVDDVLVSVQHGKCIILYQYLLKYNTHQREVDTHVCDGGGRWWGDGGREAGGLMLLSWK